MFASKFDEEAHGNPRSELDTEADAAGGEADAAGGGVRKSYIRQN